MNRLFLLMLLSTGLAYAVPSRLDSPSAKYEINPNITESHPNGILHLNVKRGSKTYTIDTRASAYHKYDVVQLSDDYIFLRSSDIGTYIFAREVDQWHKYFARKVEAGKNIIYIIFPEREDMFNSDVPYVDILFQNDNELKFFHLSGSFDVRNEHKKGYYILKEDNFIIYNGELNFVFDLNGNLISSTIDILPCKELLKKSQSQESLIFEHEANSFKELYNKNLSFITKLLGNPDIEEKSISLAMTSVIDGNGTCDGVFLLKDSSIACFRLTHNKEPEIVYVNASKMDEKQLSLVASLEEIYKANADFLLSYKGNTYSKSATKGAGCYIFYVGNEPKPNQFLTRQLPRKELEQVRNKFYEIFSIFTGKSSIRSGS